MHITRAQWLGLASDNHSLRHIYSLCLLANGADVFSYRERRLALKLVQKLETVVHLPMAGHEITKTIASDFLELEAQVAKRLERLQPPHRRLDVSSGWQC